MDLYTVREDVYADTTTLTLTIEGVYTSTRTIYTADKAAYQDALLDLTAEYVIWLRSNDEMEN